MKKKVFAAIMFLSAVSQKVFAAHLEGEEAEAPISKIDANMLMANWYKIIICIVAVGCVAGLLTANVRYFIKKHKK